MATATSEWRGAWSLRRLWPPLSLGLTVLGIGFGLYWVWLLAIHGGRPDDLHAYYAVDLANIYARPAIGGQDAFAYSPAFAQAFHPLTVLPFPTVELIWRVALVVAVGVLAGPLAPLVLFWSPVASEINVGNVHILMALAIALGVRYPATWSFILLTKVTPGIGLLWFAARREWRSLLVAIGATVCIAAVSFVAAPAAWFDWVAALALNTVQPIQRTPIPIPLVVRLPLAALLVVWGARRSRPAVLPLAALLAMPFIHFASFSLLLAVPAQTPGRSVG